VLHFYFLRKSYGPTDLKEKEKNVSQENFVSTGKQEESNSEVYSQNANHKITCTSQKQSIG
jgi:hypothetical protein